METDALRDQFVLVVEDAGPLATRLQESLEGAGATVARRALPDAARSIEEEKLSVAIVDCYPPSRERRALIRQLRKAGVPFLIYSAQAPGHITTERGAPFIAKPCPPEKIVAAVRYLVDRL